MIPLHRSVYVWAGLFTAIILLIIGIFFAVSSTETETNETSIGWKIDKNLMNTENVPSSISDVATTSASTSTSTEVPKVTLSPEPAPQPILQKSPTPATTTLSDESIHISPTPVVTDPKPKSPQKETSYSFNVSRMLSAHNEVRDTVGLLPLIWSHTIAASAQAWSEQLQSENCSMRHDPDPEYGENLFWSWRTGASSNGPVSTPDDAVTWWAGEVAFYNYEKNTCRAGEQCGHYTQIVWDNTSEVGCGVSSCIDGDKHTDMWVCRYDPPGNDGSQPY